MQCKWCKDTKKLKLLFSEVECTECKEIKNENISSGTTMILPPIDLDKKCDISNPEYFSLQNNPIKIEFPLYRYIAINGYTKNK